MHVIVLGSAPPKGGRKSAATAKKKYDAAKWFKA